MIAAIYPQEERAEPTEDPMSVRQVKVHGRKVWQAKPEPGRREARPGRAPPGAEATRRPGGASRPSAGGVAPALRRLRPGPRGPREG